mmetsp:Transcript_38613/g.89344  ORF Transcript_38613/g.89344 Transcript_38613/m.89344 type:complete len:85 (-) Transcript_38613:248-502(-)
MARPFDASPMPAIAAPAASAASAAAASAAVATTAATAGARPDPWRLDITDSLGLRDIHEEAAHPGVQHNIVLKPNMPRRALPNL